MPGLSWPDARPLLGLPLQGSKRFLRLWLPPTPSQDGASQDTRTVVQSGAKTSLTRFGVIPQESPDQSQAHSDTREEPPQLEDISSEGELPDTDSDQEAHSGTPILDELLMGREELEDYDSLNSSPVIYKTPFWKFTEQTPLYALRLRLELTLQLLRLNPRLVHRPSLQFLRLRP